MRKSIEPFVVAVRTYIELNFIDANDGNANIEKTVKTVFLSYCQKDKDIADTEILAGRYQSFRKADTDSITAGSPGT